MTNQELDNLFQAFNEGNIEVVQQCIHSNAEWHILGDKSLPLAEYNKGLGNIMMFFQRLNEYMEITKNEPKMYFRNENEPNTILILGECAAIVRHTGKFYDVPFVDKMTLNEEHQIVKYERLMETLSVFLAFNEQ